MGNQRRHYDDQGSPVSTPTDRARHGIGNISVTSNGTAKHSGKFTPRTTPTVFGDFPGRASVRET